MRKKSVKGRVTAMPVIICAAAVLVLSAVLLLCRNMPLRVGRSLPASRITELYHTRGSSARPPYSERYRFSAADGRYRFEYKRLEGERFPLGKKDTVSCVTADISEDEWGELLSCLMRGRAVKRRTHTSSGGTGPWTYVYGRGYSPCGREFYFETATKAASFEALLEKLCEKYG